MASSSAAADVSITREQLTKYFHLPITDVAKELGICATMLKKICRKNGIPRWPHRKIKSLNKMIESLEASLPNDGSEAGECIRQEIIILKNKKSLIMRNPSILVQGNPNKRSAEGDESTPKKARADSMQGPITTFNNPKASLPTTAPNSFSINQLLTPPSTFTPLTSPSLVGTDDKDYRAFAHHPHLLSSMPFPPDSKHPMDNRVSYPSPLTSYLPPPPPEDESRHVDGTPLLHPPSTDPYHYYHKAAAMAYQYHGYPRQMLPPSYPPPPHVLAAPPHIARNPYYHSFGVPPPHESPRQQQQQQQQQLTNDTHNDQQASQQPQQQLSQIEEGERSQNPTQPQTTTTHTTTHTIISTVTNATTNKAQQGQPTSQEALPKMNIPNSSDMYNKYRPPSPSSHAPSPYPSPSNADMSHFYYSQFPQQPRLHQ